MNDDDLKVEIAKLHEKLDRVLALLDAKSASAQRKAADRRAKQEKPQPLTEDEIKQQQERFQELFSRWMTGFEVEVQNELESADADALRRFADANNLNITTKTPKAKALQLIAARFREKRQLMQGLPSRRDADA
jgi:small-conductance mechanosensitive channel